MLLNVKHYLMEVKRIINIHLLCAGVKKADILKQLNVSIMIVHRVEQRLKSSESLD